MRPVGSKRIDVDRDLEKAVERIIAQRRMRGRCGTPR
jgi:hypothetical protein